MATARKAPLSRRTAPALRAPKRALRPSHMRGSEYLSFMSPKQTALWTLRKTLGEMRRIVRRLRSFPSQITPPHGVNAIGRKYLRQSSEAQAATIQDVLRFMQQCLRHPVIRCDQAFEEFLEISANSCNPCMERSQKEGYLSTANPDVAARTNACTNLTMPWTEYWFSLRETCLLAFTSSLAEHPSHVLLLDDGFQYYVTTSSDDASCSTPAACLPAAGEGFLFIHLETKQGSLVLRTRNRLQAADWMLAFRRIRDSCPYIRNKRFGSFAPARSNSYIRWLVDARNAYAAMVEAMRAAKHEILITGWWITPDIPMIRDPCDHARLHPKEEDSKPRNGAGEPSSPRRDDEEGVSRRVIREVVDPLLKLGGTMVPENAPESADVHLQKEQGITLKTVLQECANSGVQVYCQMWKEPPFSLALSSAYQKKVLKDLGPTVHVIRHGSLFWTHHEKLVIVDRKLAFVGGIDVAWCRYDTGSHILEDPDHKYFQHGLEYYNPTFADWMKVEDIWTDRFDRSKYPRMPVSRRLTAINTLRDTPDQMVYHHTFYLQWHDCHSAVMGPPVQDLVRHFVQRWNFSRIVKNKPNLPVMYPEGAKCYERKQAAREGALKQKGDAKQHQSAAPGADHPSRFAPDATPEQRCGCSPGGAMNGVESYCAHDWTKHWFSADVQALRSASMWSAGTETECSIFHAYVHAILHAKHMIYMENQYFLSNLGWTDEELRMYEDATTTAELGRHTAPDNAKSAQAAGKTGEKDRSHHGPRLASVVAAAHTKGHTSSGEPSMHQAKNEPENQGSHVSQGVSKLRWGKLRNAAQTDQLQSLAAPAPPSAPSTHWGLLRGNAGQLKKKLHARATPEASAATTGTIVGQNAVMHSAIDALVGAPRGEKTYGLRNPHSVRGASALPYTRATPPHRDLLKWTPRESSIAEALFVRLCKAIENKETFRVVIVIPVHPDGPIRTVRAIQLVLFWQSKTISRGKSSLLSRLHEKFPDVNLNDYIVFCALRNHGTLAGEAVTEQVYVHSKIMIVDDRVVIIGSANANNRSQYGDRDSECAVVVTGGESIQTRMAGKPWTATLFAHTFRRNLWEEHLGVAHSCTFKRVGLGAMMQYSQNTFTSNVKDREDNAHFPAIPLRQHLPCRRHGSSICDASHSTFLLQIPDGMDQGTQGVSRNGKPEINTEVPTAAEQPTLTMSACEQAPGFTNSATTSPVRRHADIPKEVELEAIPCVTPLSGAGDVYGFGQQREAILRRMAKLEKTCCCEALLDPCEDQVYKGIWCATAELNTRIYEEVFPGIMQNDIKTFEEWKERDALPPRQADLLRLTVGKVVYWPTGFLENEDLDTKVTEKEHYLPTKVVQ